MSVYKVKDRWAVRIDLDAGPNGQRRRRFVGTYRTRKLAEAAERGAIEARERGVDLRPGAVTVDALLSAFINDRRAKDRAVRTVEGYEGIARLYVIPHLGSMPIARLGPAHVSAWLADLRERGGSEGARLSAKTVKQAYTLLRAALQWAVRHDLAARNVADAVDPPSVGRSLVHALTNEDAARFLAAADRGRWGAFFRLALGTAARRGELCALRWDDVDFEAGVITIRRAVIESSSGDRRLVEKSTKTDRVRSIPLGTIAIDALRDQRRAQAADKLAAGPLYRDDGHVFQGPIGGAVSPFLATDAFRSIRSRLGIAASLHSLRHTAASWMLAGGIDVRTVSAVLGHSAASTTLNVYGHVVAGAEARAVAAIDDRLRNAR